MLFVFWPLSWLAFFPVVIIEAWIAKRLLSVMWRSALTRSAVANAVSTVVGIPLTWAILVIVQMLAGGGQGYGLETFPKRAYAMIVQSPWLIPYESDLNWLIPGAITVLLIPFFFTSVFIERWVFGAKGHLDKSLLRVWSWKANLVTYGIMEILVLCLLTYVIFLRATHK